jgi:hypothetical protein
VTANSDELQIGNSEQWPFRQSTGPKSRAEAFAEPVSREIALCFNSEQWRFRQSAGFKSRGDKLVS